MVESTGFITGRGGLRLFYRVWRPEQATRPEQPVRSMILVHGMNEHSGRYVHVADYFTTQGFAVYALDQRGFGRSEGTRCHVDRFDDYLHDLRLFADLARADGKPVMIGHSLGGLIAFHYALAFPDTIAALVLSGPPFRTWLKPKLIEKLAAPLLSRLLPGMQFSTRDALRPEYICRDPGVVQAYEDDPLVGRTASVRFYTEVMGAVIASRQGAAARLNVPVLFLHGEDDRLNDPLGTREVFEQVPSPRKAIRLYPGKYHEIFNDPGYTEVFTGIMNWLQEHDPL